MRNEMLQSTAWPPTYDEAFVPPASQQWWAPELEQASEAERSPVILEKLQGIVAWTYQRSTFYRSKWDEAGVGPQTLRSLDDLSRFPVVTKAELRADQL